MAVTATFYNFSKRKNSTKVIDVDGTDFEVNLKGTTSLLRPVFLLSADSFNYNYCNFNGRYYWIDDIRSIRNDLWSVECSVDVLASWKSDIVNTTAMVLYSASDNNQLIKDSRNVVTTAVTRTAKYLNMDMFDITGSYVLATLSGPASEAINNSFSVLYGLTAGSLGALAQEFNNPDTLTAIKQFFDNPTETIVFCRWLPRNLIGGPTRLVPVKFGDYESSVTGTLIEENFASEIGDIEIPWQTSDFRNYEPYSSAILYLPGVGNIQLPLASLAGLDTLSIQCVMDYVTNQIHYQVTDGTGANCIGTYSGSVGVDIPIAAVQSGNVVGTAGGLAAVAGALGVTAATGLTAGTGAALIGGLYTAATSSVSQLIHSAGSYGGGYNVKAGGTTIRIEIFRNQSVQEPSEYVNIIGNPCMKTRQISGLSGYCQTEDFQVAGTMTEQEKEQINSAMNGGVYIE